MFLTFEWTRSLPRNNENSKRQIWDAKIYDFLGFFLHRKKYFFPVPKFFLIVMSQKYLLLYPPSLIQVTKQALC